ncbi:phosphatase PAP2 family protein [Mesorhizobium sp. BH1-1-5]|uniref:phosphatase PAP2 family protein n=1 Tax=Mesorhizobium sp. BH1-1-5 TaxID=2876661 RepID=UPI0021E335FB|nr:phosphatase PAP2 family protein [Mesorhizobium sp. BH1-1-5]
MAEASVAAERPYINVERRIAVAAVAYAAAAALSSWDAFAFLLGRYAVTQFLALPVMLVSGLGIASAIARPSAPLSYLRELLRERAIGAAWIVAIFCFAIAAFSTFKFQISAWLPFFADRFLADLDELIHFGQPWRQLHAITPDWVAIVIGFAYGPIWFVQWFGFLLFAAFLTNHKLRVRYLAAFSATLLLLGTVLRAAAASAGPIFYNRAFASDRFADLMEALPSVPSGQETLSTANYLFASYASDEAVFGVDISAMPSIHVAILAGFMPE